MVEPLKSEQSTFRGTQFESPAATFEASCLPNSDNAIVKDNTSPQTKPAAVLSVQEQCQQTNDQPEEVKFHLDLFNFDSPIAEGNRYVLTSPHSLEACARCGVKPVELLPRPLSDFAREAPGRSMRVATGMFEIYERDRFAKLRHCREERERIIREEKKRIQQAALHIGPSASEKSQNFVGPGLTKQTNCIVQYINTVSSSSNEPKKQSLSFTVKNSTAGSGQDTSVISSSSCLVSKHSTVISTLTPKVNSGKKTKLFKVEFRKNQLAKRSTQQSSQSEFNGSKKNSSNAVKSTNTFPRSTRQPSFPKTSNSLVPIIPKSAAQSPANGITNSFAHQNGHAISNTKVRCRSHSLESLQRRRDTVSSSTASTTNTTTITCTSSESVSSTYSWDGERDYWTKTSKPRARTLATFSSLMGRSLSLGDLSHSPQTTEKVERIVKEVKRRGLKAVPERDRKIAALMLARYQEEDIISQTRYVAHLQWDSERRVEELRREREEREKQRAVLQCQRAWQSQVSTRQHWLNQQEQEAAETKLRQAVENEERWKELAERQEHTRLQKLQQAAREEKHKKSLQEQNLKALEEERAAIVEQEKLLLKEKLTIAELKRQEREHQIQEERRGLNRAEKRRHAALIQEIARRESDEREEARRSAHEKLSRSLENYEQIQEKRSQEMKEKAKREQLQTQKAKRVAEKRDQQQKEQIEAKVKEAEKRAEQATQVAEERSREKAKRAVQSRQEKERLQRLNRQRVEEEEKQRRLELLQSIERKLEKSERIFREKQAVLESARSVARASFHVRDRVRVETNMRTFDKMVLDAQLKANLVEK